MSSKANLNPSREVEFKERSRFRPWEIKRLEVLCGLQVMHVYMFVDAVMKSFDVHHIPEHNVVEFPGGPEPESEWQAFV